MILAEWAPYSLQFRFEARTSRAVMSVKDTYFVRLTDTDSGQTGIGECALFRGLSADDMPDYEQRLARACADPLASHPESSIRFGFESVLASLRCTSPDDAFHRGEQGIPINGLIWMGDRELMRCRIDEKLAAGFSVLKLKIGGIDFESELALLRYIRSRYSADTLEIRLDANGAFAPDVALDRLSALAKMVIHSIEQPIRAGQWEAMSRICAQSPIPVALDEELIGISTTDREELLDAIGPQYIILKPALCGGLSGASEWADMAEGRGIGWWATSALESNIGLHAIASWAAERRVSIPQGLGTGGLYHNNIPSPLELRGMKLFFNPQGEWQVPVLSWQA